MLKTPLRLVLIAIVLCLQTGITYSQTPSFDCPPDFDIQEWSTPANPNGAVLEPWPYRFWGSVKYYYQDDGSKRSIIVDWSTLSNPSDFSDNTVKELLTFIMCREEGFLNSDGVKEIAFNYKSDCKVDLSCKLKVDENQDVVCCDAGFEGDPGIYEINGIKYFEVTHPLNCGFKCCEKIYSYTCMYNDITHEYDVIFNGTTNNTISDCDNSQTYYDCKTGLPKPCNASCP